MIYLIHFDAPYKHAQHYLGFMEADVEGRVKRHESGGGARLLDVVKKAGIAFRVVRVWIGTRSDERKFKVASHIKKYCPACTARPWARKDIEEIFSSKGDLCLPLQ